MKNRMNIYLGAGLFIFALYLFLKHSGLVPISEFFGGFLTGLSLALMLIGSFMSALGIGKIREFKTKLLRKVLK